jgi:polyhydroxyalkanoate synthesis regulator phasin
VDELIKNVTEKAGINSEQAKKAVESVLDFIKEKVPLVGDQLKGLLEGGGGGLASKLGGMFGGKS